MNWKEIVKLVAPLVLSQTKLAPIAPYIADGINTAEDLAKGHNKLSAARKETRIVVNAINAQKGKEIVDPDLTDAAIESGISAVVKAADAIHKPIL